ncbi:putative phosphoinositide phosphatase (Sac1) [Tuber indicum]|nr:putative phosphoinositide phosphatase (Sac1) [Tuber indicum]
MSVTNYPFRDISIIASASHYTFRSPSSPNAPALVVARPSGAMQMTHSPNTMGGKRVTIAGILGIVHLRLDKYIVIITKAAPVGRIRGQAVYKVESTEFLPLQERVLHDPDEDTYLELLTAHLRSGPMYFSYSFDLTNSFQRQSSADPSLPLWQRADDRFFWNRHLQTDLIGLHNSHQAVDPYILPVFFGYLNITTTTIKSTPLTFALITRKSRHRAGTRYFTRGIDESGNVANFNETEQIIVIGDSAGGLAGYDSSSISSGSKEQVQVFSYVQTRGSVPVYWSEVINLRPIPELKVRSVDLALIAAKKHFDEQIKLYGDNYLINLVNQSGREEEVKTAYENAVKELVSSPIESKEGSEQTTERFHIIESTRANKLMDHLHYIYFDFHHECRGMKWDRAQALLDNLGDGLYDQGYYHSVEENATTSNSIIKKHQSSVMRTNCMDCLDRTNVVQSMLARWTLNSQLMDIGILDKGENTADFENFEAMFRNAWADNADVVSRAYSGTGALKTDFTRTGNRTKAGALADGMNSVTRYICNNFADGPRQDAYDLFLGNYTPSTSLSSLLFVDRRPIIIQSVPYILMGALFLDFAALFFPDLNASPSLDPVTSGGGNADITGRSGTRFSTKLFVLFWAGIAILAAQFMLKYALLYVNWPKLSPPGFAIEGYSDALNRAKKDPLIGKWVGKQSGHERGASSIRLVHLEEGKKRIE